MANYTNLNNLFTDMANAIRAKTGSTATIIADNFPTEIENLRTGFDYANQDVVAIPDYAFYGCEDLNSVDCYNLTSVGSSAFENCTNLKTAILYDGVVTIGENAFKGCGEGLTIYCYFDSQPDAWHENWNPDECEVDWCGGVVKTLNCSSNYLTAYNIGKLYTNIYKDGHILIIDGDTTITQPHGGAYSPFTGNKITSVIINNGVTGIGNYAFDGCSSLTSIVIPNSVTIIGKYAFYDCSSLKSIIMPERVTSSIGEYAFNGCSSLTSITIPDGVTGIGVHAFEGCSSLTSIVIPNSTTAINDHAFKYCSSLTSITIPDSVTSIGNWAFSNCSKLTSIIYTGTTAQWNTIIKDTNWNYKVPATHVQCSDGQAAL